MSIRPVAPLPRWFIPLTILIVIACGLAATALWMSRNKIDALRSDLEATRRSKEDAEGRLSKLHEEYRATEHRLTTEALARATCDAERDQLKAALPLRMKKRLTSRKSPESANVQWEASIENPSSNDVTVRPKLFCYKDQAAILVQREGTSSTVKSGATATMKGEIDWPIECSYYIFTVVLIADKGGASAVLDMYIF